MKGFVVVAAIVLLAICQTDTPTATGSAPAAPPSSADTGSVTSRTNFIPGAASVSPTGASGSATTGPVTQKSYFIPGAASVSPVPTPSSAQTAPLISKTYFIPGGASVSPILSPQPTPYPQPYPQPGVIARPGPYPQPIYPQPNSYPQPITYPQPSPYPQPIPQPSPQPLNIEDGNDFEITSDIYNVIAKLSNYSPNTAVATPYASSAGAPSQSSIQAFALGSSPSAAGAKSNDQPSNTDIKISAPNQASVSSSAQSLKSGPPIYGQPYYPSGYWARRLRCKTYYTPNWKICCWVVWWWVWQ